MFLETAAVMVVGLWVLILTFTAGYIVGRAADPDSCPHGRSTSEGWVWTPEMEARLTQAKKRV